MRAVLSTKQQRFVEKVSPENTEFLDADEQRQAELLEQVFVQAPVDHGLFEHHRSIHLHQLLDALLVPALRGDQ